MSKTRAQNVNQFDNCVHRLAHGAGNATALVCTSSNVKMVLLTEGREAKSPRPRTRAAHAIVMCAEAAVCRTRGYIAERVSVKKVATTKSPASIDNQ